MVIGTPTVLNLIPGGVMKVIHVNQVNENIEIQFRIMNGAQPFNVPEGVSCTIRGTKGDNFGYAADVAVTAGSNIVTVTLTEQLTAVAGAGNIFELVFVGASDDMKVSTENFLLDVERAALGEDTVISDSDLAYADQVLDQLQSVGAVNAQVQQNKANIAAEITRATAAEQTLQQNINAEAAARQAADNTLQSNINAEASSRATTDASLQSQINQLVAPSGSAPSAAEVENARIGSDGTVYPTLGDAIRTQNSLLKSQIDDIANNDQEIYWFNQTVSGTRLVTVAVGIPAGDYYVSVDALASTDTQYTSSRMTFFTPDGNVSKDVTRGNDGWNTTVTLPAKTTGIGFYGAHNYSDSAGAEFTYSNVVVKQTTQLKGKLDDLSEQVTAQEDQLNALFNLELGTTNLLSASVKGKAYSGNVGQAYSIGTSAKRFSVIPPVEIPYDTNAVISVSSGYRVSYRTIDANDIVLSDSGWITESRNVTFSKNNRYCFTGGMIGDADTTLSDYLEHVVITTAPQLIDDINDLLSTKTVLIPCYTENLKAVNHRGYNTVAPENTLPAFKLSKQMGFKYVETDVRFTSDGVPVLLHDTTINRTARNADGTEISETVNIADITYTQALTYDFGIYQGAEYAGTKIPTLDEFVKLCKNIGLTPRIELNVLTIANAVTMYEVIEKYGMTRKVEYNCNNLDVAAKFLELEPKATIVYGMSSYNANTVDAVGALKTSENEIIINMYYNQFSEEFISKCKTLKIIAEAWTIDTISAIQTLMNNYPYVTGITSDSLNVGKIYFDSEMA